MFGLLIVSAALFSVQFLFNQKFSQTRGDGIAPTLTFLAVCNTVSFFVMLILNGFQLQFSWFSFACAIGYCGVCLGYSYFSLKAFGQGDLSAFSVFAMLGGMLLPAVYGMLFAQEAVTWPKIACLGVILLALLLSSDSKLKKRNLLYYFAVFFFNGMVGVIAKAHQSAPQAVDSNSFFARYCAISVALSGLWHLLLTGKIPTVGIKEGLFAGGYALCNGIGNLLCLIALTVLPASAQYPFITGGCICFSAVIGWSCGEKISARKILAVVISLGATCLAMI